MTQKEAGGPAGPMDLVVIGGGPGGYARCASPSTGPRGRRRRSPPIGDVVASPQLGVHIVGPRATDLIGEACAAMKMEATVEELARTIHPHPTLTEGTFEAANAVYGQAIHM
jgi:Pyridine nucleotide-disulphide oxidoreductase, dimerisation domain